MANEHFLNDPYIAWELGAVKDAFRLFRAQAEAGDKSAFLNVGYFYDVGLGTRQSRDEGRRRLAFEWFKRAASMNDGDAGAEVARYYLAGTGVGQHRGRAIAALKRALASSHITEGGREVAQSILNGLKVAK